MVYVRCSRRIQLSRPRITGCCIVSCGTMHVHTTRSTEEALPCKNWMLNRTDVEVRRRADLPKPPPRTRGRVSFVVSRHSVAVFHVGPSFSGDEGLGRAGIQEGS